jgi:hypothetical protein
MYNRAMLLMVLQSMRVNSDPGIEVLGSQYQDSEGVKGWHIRHCSEPSNTVKEVWVIDGKYPEGLSPEERRAVASSIKVWEEHPSGVEPWTWSK